MNKRGQNRKTHAKASQTASIEGPASAHDINEKRYPVPQAAEKLGIATKTLWGWIGARSISVYRVGRSVRIGEREIARILEEGFTPARRAA